jgi:hypothetical protein
MKRFCFIILFLLPIACLNELWSQEFIHPGIDQTKGDLDHMKKLVLNGEQPCRDAFDRLIRNTDIELKITPFEHVMRGPYGRPNIGGAELSKSAELAYDCAIIWYINGDRKYSEKAIEILNSWSPALRDFDYNDAKLLAGWTGQKLCNAAEILRYTDSGWRKKDIDIFTDMLMTVYFPLLRNFYPQANGNWDGAIIRTLMAIGIFADNHEIFNSAINHYMYGPVNGSLFKYIYPDGQCQESIRDQAHVQMGLIEFAGAARIAFTQGKDLFSIGANRLALGFEYTLGYIMGETPHCYGGLSSRGKELRHDYEFVYRHYMAKGVEMPFTKMAADSVRNRESRNILTAIRVPDGEIVKKAAPLKPGKTAYPAGASAVSDFKFPPNSIFIVPGQSIQSALDSLSGTGGWVVAKAGLHTIPGTLMIPSGVTLAGEGVRTVLLLYNSPENRDAAVNRDPDLHDVTIRDLIIEGGLRSSPGPDPNTVRSFRSNYNRGGIIFRSNEGMQMKNINLINLTIRNCTFNGVLISGADKVNVVCCNFNENGAGIVPGPKLQHNLLLTNCSDVTVRDSRLVASPNGCGVAASHCMEILISGNEIARNGYYGILISESEKAEINDNFIEANDFSGIMSEFLHYGSKNIKISGNTIQYNNGAAIEAYGVFNLKAADNDCIGNNITGEQVRISDEKRIIAN